MLDELKDTQTHTNTMRKDEVEEPQGWVKLWTCKLTDKNKTMMKLGKEVPQ